MATFTKFYCFAEDMAEKKHNLATDTLKMALTNSAPSQTNTILANITQVSLANLSSTTLVQLTSSQTLGVYRLVINDITLTASGTVGPFRYMVIYNDTASSDPLICYADIGSATTLVSPQTMTVDFDGTNGLLSIT